MRKPEITFDLDLRGMLFSEVPGLNREIQKRLVTIISNEAVEPARIWIDMKTPFYNLVTRKQTGRRGQLKVQGQRACKRINRMPLSLQAPALTAWCCIIALPSGRTHALAAHPPGARSVRESLEGRL